MLNFSFRFFFARVLDNAIYRLQTSRYTWEKFRRASSSTAASWQVGGQTEQYKERTGMFSSCLQDGLHWVSGHVVSKSSRHQEIRISLTRGARIPNLQGVITHASHLCSQRSFGLRLRMNGMHITQFDHARLDLLLLVIWFWSSVTWNIRKVRHWSKSVLTFDRCGPHSLKEDSFPSILLWNLRAGQESKDP